MTPAISMRRLERARQRYLRQNRAANTLRGYRSDWKQFTVWCQKVRRKALPARPRTVALYATWMIESGKRVSTTERHLAGIRAYHLAAGAKSPVGKQVRAVLTGAKRALREQPRQKLPLTVAQLRRISVNLMDGTNRGIRDRAIIVFGFAGALRVSTIVDLELRDVDVRDDGILVRLRHEKGNQQGEPRWIALMAGRRAATCPVRTLRAWLEIRGAEQGKLFTRINDPGEYLTLDYMSAYSVERIVKRAVRSIGEDERAFGFHSCRAGFVTAAGEAGLSEWLISKQTGHRDMRVLRAYFRSFDPLRSNPSSAIGL